MRGKRRCFPPLWSVDEGRSTIGDDNNHNVPLARYGSRASEQRSLKRRTLPFFGAASNIAVALASRARICARNVEVGATPKMKSRPLARQKSIVSGVQ